MEITAKNVTAIAQNVKAVAKQAQAEGRVAKHTEFRGAIAAGLGFASENAMSAALNPVKDKAPAKPRLKGDRIDAEVWCDHVRRDGSRFTVDVDARHYLMEATLDDLKSLAGEGFSCGHEADNLYYSAEAAGDEKALEMADYIGRRQEDGDDAGFGTMINEDELITWLDENRPEVGKALRQYIENGFQEPEQVLGDMVEARLKFATLTFLQESWVQDFRYERSNGDTNCQNYLEWRLHQLEHKPGDMFGELHDGIVGLQKLHDAKPEDRAYLLKKAMQDISDVVDQLTSGTEIDAFNPAANAVMEKLITEGASGDVERLSALANEFMDALDASDFVVDPWGGDGVVPMEFKCPEIKKFNIFDLRPYLALSDDRSLQRLLDSGFNGSSKDSIAIYDAFEFLEQIGDPAALHLRKMMGYGKEIVMKGDAATAKSWLETHRPEIAHRLKWPALGENTL